MNARAQQAHSAQQALANLRAQNPQLGQQAAPGERPA